MQNRPACLHEGAALHEKASGGVHRGGGVSARVRVTEPLARTACEPQASISGAGAISDVKQGLFLYGGEQRANLQAKTKPKSFDGVRACKFGGGAADACGNGKH